MKLFKAFPPYLAPCVSSSLCPSSHFQIQSPYSSSMSLYLFNSPALLCSVLPMFLSLSPSLSPCQHGGTHHLLSVFSLFLFPCQRSSVCKHPDTSPIALSPCKISVRPQVFSTGQTSNNTIQRVREREREIRLCMCVCLHFFGVFLHA